MPAPARARATARATPVNVTFTDWLTASPAGSV